MINNKQKALLHVAKAQLGLTEEEYRDILKNHGGAESSVHLDEFGLEKVMRFFSEIGFKRKKDKGLRSKEKGPRRKDLTILASEGQRKVIYHLMEDLGWWPARLMGFIEKMTGKERPEELTKREAAKVIEGLKAMRNRNVKWN
jgi:hypothetical protein